MDVQRQLIAAFPSALADHARRACIPLREAAASLRHAGFEVSVDGEVVTIPRRIYTAGLPRIGPDTDELTLCLLTRHTDGHLRQAALRRLLDSDERWISPFVVQLIGEYIIEIHADIADAYVHGLPLNIRHFALDNPRFIALTKARIIGYRDCYYRHLPSQQYPALALAAQLSTAALQP